MSTPKFVLGRVVPMLLPDEQTAAYPTIAWAVWWTEQFFSRRLSDGRCF
jgi:hypothetical protein